MPEGVQLTLGISPLLTQLAIGYMGTQDEYIADMIFPTVPVAAPAGIFPIWNRGDFLRQGGKRLANREAPPLVNFATGKGTYSTDYWGVSANWTAFEVAQAAQQGISEAQLREGHVTNTTEKALIDREITVAAAVQTPGNWTKTYTSVTSNPVAGTSFIQWNLAASTPVTDIKNAKKAIKKLTGKTPNKLVISEDVKDALLINAQVLALWMPSFTGKDRPTVLNIDQLKTVLELEDILVGSSVYNSAAEGQADNIQNIWSNTAWLGYTNPTPTIRTPSAGYTFVWTGDTTAGLPAGVPAPESGPAFWGSQKNEKGLFIRYYETPRPQARWIDCTKFDQPNIVGKDLGATFQTPLG